MMEGAATTKFILQYCDILQWMNFIVRNKICKHVASCKKVLLRAWTALPRFFCALFSLNGVNVLSTERVCAPIQVRTKSNADDAANLFGVD